MEVVNQGQPWSIPWGKGACGQHRMRSVDQCSSVILLLLQANQMQWAYPCSVIPGCHLLRRETNNWGRLPPQRAAVLGPQGIDHSEWEEKKGAL